MNLRENLRTNPRAKSLRWAIPGLAVLVVAGAVAVPIVSASASPSLPSLTAAQLLAKVEAAQPRPLSGTVVETARLGLPQLPDAVSSGVSPISLLTGSHTVRVWYGGPGLTRLALVGNLQESDVVHNGRDLWLWSSKDKTATHLTLPADAATAKPDAAASKAKALGNLTPQQAAQQALAAVDPSTAVSVDGTARVAGRAAYELVLRPKDARSLVGSVRIATDAKTWLPLRVEVFAKGADKPAFVTGFTAVTFSQPPASSFRFTPPPGTKVENKDLSTLSSSMGSSMDKASGSQQMLGAHGKVDLGLSGLGKPTVIGTGWTSIVEVTGVDLGKAAGADQSAGALLSALKPVSGTFGSGRVIKTALVSALITDNGKLYVGAVPPSMLEAAAASASTPSASTPSASATK